MNDVCPSLLSAYYRPLLALAGSRLSGEVALAVATNLLGRHG
jgi:hypothetical protein